METIMRTTRTPVMLALAGLLASLVTFVSSGTAVAAEYIPPTQWSSVAASRYGTGMVTSPSGSVTMPCSYASSAYFNLKTYSATGQLIRQIPATQTVDGVPNCIDYPAVDKNDDIYGVPAGYVNGSLKSGPIVAYDGNTKKWQYPTGCTSTYSVPVVGADGNIYFVNGSGRLIGLTPEVEPGTTQPKKVLDVQAQGGCGTKLYAFKDGVAVRWYYNQRITYYSYAGVSLGSPAGDYDNDGWGFTFNANGRLFYPTFVGSGSTASFTLSAYDPMTKKVAWTAQTSSFGQYGAGHVRTMPTPDGGAYVIVQRKKVVAGAPTSETVNAIVKLNAVGIKVWDKELPNQDANGNSYEGASPQVDVTGKISIIRWGQMQTTNASYRRSISIGVFNPDGTVAYSQVMRGNLTHTEGSTFGYYANQYTVGQGTLHLMAERCDSTCSSPDSATKMYPITVSGLGMDYPRGAVLERTKRPAALYRAFGDSFSSGEGVEPFETGTASPNLNTCHRSDYAYPRLISGTSAKIPSLGSNGFRACSGAVTDNITDATQWNEGTQLDLPTWPDTTTQLVTMTIGGNDIKFGDLGMACVTASCAIGSSAYNASLNEVNNTLPGKLKATYERVLKYTPNAKVYVLGYPHVIANKTASDAFDSRCFYMYDNSNTTNKWADVQGARDIVTKLNGKIKDQVDVVRAMNADYNQRLKYVPLDGPDSPFIGHEVCGTATSSWFQNVDQAGNNTAYVFHPNKAGYEGYATVAGTAINAG
ncbi:SGNH/GDSL hydrolase family protein [Streptomyces sp. NPDC002611]